MRHAAHEAARTFLDALAEDLVNTNDAGFERKLDDWTNRGFPELAFYRGDRPRGRGEIIAEIRKAQRALDGDERALAQATRDELPVLAGALRVAARTLTNAPEGQAVTVADTSTRERPSIIYRDGIVLRELPSNEPSAAKPLLSVRPRPKPPIPSLDHVDPDERGQQPEETGLANLLGQLWRSGEEAATQTADALTELWESGKATAGEILDSFETLSVSEPGQGTERAGSPFKNYRARLRPEVTPPMILNPTGGQRRDDSRGGGSATDTRTAIVDGKPVVRMHRAVDLEATPGQIVVSPIAGRITKIGQAYKQDKESELLPGNRTVT